MKELFLSFGFLNLFFFSCGSDIQEKDVPSVVKNTFITNYAGAVAPEWEKENDNYEVEFKLGDTEQAVLIDAAGKVLVEKKEIATADIPETILNSIAQNFKDKKVDEAELIEKDGQVYYEIELEGKFFDKEIVMNQNGEINKNLKF